MKRVSLGSRIKAVETLISIANGATRIKNREVLSMMIEHARQAVAALEWLKDHPTAYQLSREETAGAAE